MREPAQDRGALARQIADAALAVPGVTRLVGGSGVEVATHYPGGKVVGVGLTDEVVSIHVAVDRAPFGDVIDAVVEAAAGVLADAGDARRVEIVLEDIEDAALRPPSAPEQGRV